MQTGASHCWKVFLKRMSDRLNATNPRILHLQQVENNLLPYGMNYLNRYLGDICLQQNY